MKKLAFRRIAVVNRGEPAMRLLHAVRELNQQYGWQLQTIALYTDPDRHSMFVREADDRYHIGEATFIDSRDQQRKSSYLDYERLERALTESRADAAWVGWGFVAEHAEFADLCDSLGIRFIGPSGDVMRSLGDKIASKRLAEQANVPVAPWSNGAVDTVHEARRHAEALGYPVIIKASAGGGGRGIRRVKRPEELENAFNRAKSEALKSFGDATVFLEAMIVGARHVEVQIVGDDYGTVWAVGVRDCTIQRRNQKVIEEAPSPVLTTEEDGALRAAAVRLAKAAGYSNAGTVECLFDPKNRRFCFMEMNTRLQVEHPVTEQTTGLDLVKLQLQLASGTALEGEPPPPFGHAIEVRLNAEDPDNDFAPAPGRVELFDMPTGPGIRIDTGVGRGDTVPPDFDSMIAKYIAFGRDRGEALGRLRRALIESAVVIRGGSSNKAFLLELLAHPDVVSGDIDIGWLDRLTEVRGKSTRALADVALLRAAIDVYEEEFSLEKARFFAGAARGRPVVNPEIGCKVELATGGQTYEIEAFRLGADLYRLRVEGCTFEAAIDRQSEHAGWLTIDGKRHRVISIVDGLRHFVEVDGMPHQISRDDGGMVRAPAPAVVLSISVEPGDVVAQGDQLLVLEAMKMEMAVNAPFAGKVRSIEILPNQQVDAGAALVMVEPENDADNASRGERIAFQANEEATRGPVIAQAHAILTELRRVLLGYDIAKDEAAALRTRRAAICEQLPPDDPELWRLEDELIGIFGDLLPLFRRESNGDPVSAEEHLQSYLHSIDARGERLPARFLATLKAALRRYGFHDLERTPELESALVFLLKARARLDRNVDQIFGLLERRLQNAEAIAGLASPEFRQQLDRLISETHGRYLPLNDVARELRYVLYVRPFLARARQETYAQVKVRLAALLEEIPAKDPSARTEQVGELVNCPQPMVSFFASTYAESNPLRALAVEVMLRRNYRMRTLSNLAVAEHEGYHVATADYEHQGRPGHAIVTASDFCEVTAAVEALRPVVAGYPAGDEICIDVCTCNDDIDDILSLARRAANALAGVHISQSLRRVCVAVVKPGNLPTLRYFTFLQSEMGFVEEEVLRGIHPMLAERLELWRLVNFETTQLRVSDDIYLFHAVARDNPKDERLFALLEVRDITPVIGEDGEVLDIPSISRIYLEALSYIREFQSRRDPRQRLHWNRALMFIRPDVAVDVETARRIIRRLAPAAKGLGLEKVVVQTRLRHRENGEIGMKVIHASNRAGTGLEIRIVDPTDKPIRSVTPYAQRVVRMRAFGLVYPYEIIRMLTPNGGDGTDAEFPPGKFVEHDLDETGKLVPVERQPGSNTANVVLGVIENSTTKHPEGMRRVICLGDGSRSMGSLAEPECRLLIEGLDLAERMKVPFEWFAVSSGAKISMEVGTEGLDWIARVIRRLVEFTQAGGEVNIIVPGVNVGGQSYFNAEATMLMHTRGILIMTPNASMVLTGKKALDYSGGVSAEDNQGIGGVERIMGFNGQAQFAAKDIAEACHILFRYYEHSYVQPGERWPRRGETNDPVTRDVCESPHDTIEGTDFRKIGEIFAAKTNPDRKKPFDIRSVMRATVDCDLAPLERWSMMRLAETAVVWDAHLGGYPVTLIGIESRPLTRLGFVPGDGPDVWTGGTLFPRSSKKVARAINAASNNRPVVVLANLSGFDGSPESMREWQLEYGAEIGRAVVNFGGPIVFCVISRYHGGAYVVFSGTLNDNMQVAAVEGSRASVIGGAPAAAVVFPREVKARLLADPRFKAAQAALANARDDVDRGPLRADLAKVQAVVLAEKQGEVADYFDSVHNVQRAKDVGSLHDIITPQQLRPWLIEAVERGMERDRGA